MKKTQKVNKGPSAFERVKAKYGKSVMNVGKKKVKEELDLTKVAEAFGGHIVEQEQTEYQKQQERQQQRRKQGGPGYTGKIDPGSKEAGEEILKKIQSFSRNKKKFKKGETTGTEQPKRGSTTIRNPENPQINLFTGKPEPPQEVPVKTTYKKKPKTGPQGSQNETPLDKLLRQQQQQQDQQTFNQMFKDVRTRKPGEKPDIEDPFGEPKPEQETRKPRKPRRIPFKEKPVYSPEVQKKLDAINKEIENRPLDKRTKKYKQFIKQANRETLEKERDRVGEVRRAPDIPKPKVSLGDPTKEKKKETETQTQSSGGGGGKGPRITTSGGETFSGGNGAFSKIRQFARKDPVAALAGYDLGKGILGKIMKARVPNVPTPRAIRVSAKS